MIAPAARPPAERAAADAAGFAEIVAAGRPVVLRGQVAAWLAAGAAAAGHVAIARYLAGSTDAGRCR